MADQENQPEGIRIRDLALDISPNGLEALIRKQGAEVSVTRLDLAVSPEALTALLSGLTPPGQTSPEVTLEDGRVQVAGERDGKPFALDLRVGGFRIEIRSGGLRLYSE